MVMVELEEFMNAVLSAKEMSPQYIWWSYKKQTIQCINGEFMALGYTPTPAPHYTTSFTHEFTSELTDFDAGIDHWTGPIITEKYKAKFHKNELKPKHFISNQAKFNSKCVNRLDKCRGTCLVNSLQCILEVSNNI